MCPPSWALSQRLIVSLCCRRVVHTYTQCTPCYSPRQRCATRPSHQPVRCSQTQRSHLPALCSLSIAMCVDMTCSVRFLGYDAATTCGVRLASTGCRATCAHVPLQCCTHILGCGSCHSRILLKVIKTFDGSSWCRCARPCLDAFCASTDPWLPAVAAAAANMTQLLLEWRSSQAPAPAPAEGPTSPPLSAQEPPPTPAGTFCFAASACAHCHAASRASGRPHVCENARACLSQELPRVPSHFAVGDTDDPSCCG